MIMIMKTGRIYKDLQTSQLFLVLEAKYVYDGNEYECLMWTESKPRSITHVKLADDVLQSLFQDVTTTQKMPKWFGLFIGWATTAIIGKENDDVLTENF